MLTSLDSVKAWLSIPTETVTDDDLLIRLITAASGFIENYLNRTILAADFTGTFNGTGGSVMPMPNYPVNAVSSVVVDNVEIPLSINKSNGYFFSDTIVGLRGFNFTRGMCNVQIVYKAGFSALPVDIEQACIELVSVRYRERDRIGQVSKSVGGEVVSFSQKDMPDSVKTTLKNYKKVIPW